MNWKDLEGKKCIIKHVSREMGTQQVCPYSQLSRLIWELSLGSQDLSINFILCVSTPLIMIYWIKDKHQTKTYQSDLKAELELRSISPSLQVNGTVTSECGCCGVATFHLLDEKPRKRVCREMERQTDRWTDSKS